MGVQCQILIKKAKEGVHRPGQAVRGKVRYYVDEPTEYQDVTLSFLGKGKCKWRQGNNKNRRTYRGREDYVIVHVNVWNKKPEDTITLLGKYEHPFEFFLPEDIPGTYKDRICYNSYRLELKFVKTSFFSFNKVFTAEVPVYSYINPTIKGPIIIGLEKELFTLFSAKIPVVNLKAQIEKTYLTPGENAHISYVVTNNTDVEITSVKTELYCYTTYTADCGRKKEIEGKVATCEAETLSIAENKVTKFLCIIPTLSELYSITYSKVISIEYRVRVTVRLPMPHLNAKVEIPVLIGEVKGEAEQTLEVEDSEDPPTYWEAMNDNEKNKGNKSDSDSDSD